METVRTDNDVRFSQGETVILQLLLDMAKVVYKDDNWKIEEIEAMEHALHNGEHGDVLGDHLDVQPHSEEVKKEVFDILEMWSQLELAYERMPDERQQSIQRRLGEHWELDVRFHGYDSHVPQGEEGYLSYTKYLIRRGRYTEPFKGRQLDGEVGPHLLRYRAMVEGLRKYTQGEFLAGVFDWHRLNRQECSEETLNSYEEILVELFSIRG